MPGDDGSSLLTGDQVGGLLDAAVRHAGGSLLAWELDHVDANPGQSTTATYLARVAWPYGEREEMLGVSARATGLSDTDTNTAALTGREAVVVEPIGAGGGLVEIGGDTWTARALFEHEGFDYGERVLVHEIRGATALLVRAG